MIVGIIGGGAVGSVIISHIVKGESINKVYLMDTDKNVLDRLRSKIDRGMEKVVFINEDAEKNDSLKNIVSKVDLIVNAATPDINIPLMKICYRHRVHYIDLANDEVNDQLKFHRDWEKRGITGVLGMGVDPGLTNIFARYITDRMDKVEEIRIRDGDTSYTKEYILAVLYSPSVFLDEVLYYPAMVFRRGRFKLEPPLSGEEKYKFPEPVGELHVYSVSHEEVETLPLYINKGLKYVDFKISFSKEVVQILFALDKMGLTKKTGIKLGKKKVIPRDVLIRLMPRPESLVGKVKGYAVVLTEVKGKVGKDVVIHKLFTIMSHQEAYKKYNTTATAFQTGTPPAALVLLMAENKINIKGVFPPEVLQSEILLSKIKELGLPMEEEIIHRRKLEV